MRRRTFLSFVVMLCGCSSGSNPATEPVRVTLSHSFTPGVSTSTPTSIASFSSSLPSQVVSSLQASEVRLDDAAACARKFVDALIRADVNAALAVVYPPAIETIRPWIGVPFDAEVVDAVVLEKAAGRARIGVGVAFEPAADGTITEPIAYVVDLIVESPLGCRVTGVGYA
jgi:hypothetical protein